MPEITNKTTDNRSLVKISIVLIILALLAIVGRHSLVQDSIAQLDSIWQLTVNSRFQADENNSIVNISPPIDTQFARVVAQQLLHSGLKIQRTKSGNDQQNTRLIYLVAKNKGIYELSADFTVHLKQKESGSPQAALLPPTSSNIESFLKNDPDLQIDSEEVQQKIIKLGAGATDIKQLAEKIFQYSHKNILTDKKHTHSDIISAIKTGKATHLMRAKTMVALGRAASIPARLITGFILEENLDARPVYWVDFLLDNRWASFDPLKGYQYELPENYLPMRRNNDELVGGISISKLTTEYEISQIIDRKGYYLTKNKSLLDIINLNRLPLETRQSLAILMLLPLGALFTALVRSLVGVRTYGTFTPALIGLAAHYADWITALMIFFIVAVLGLSGRHFIHGKLLRTPRLTIVFTLVALAMTLGVSLLDYFNLNASGHVVLLPIVILTALVDRIYTLADDNGIHTAMVRLGWTLAVALVCLGILQLEWLGHLLLQYPESQLVTVAMILLLSTYSGKKILHWLPLKWLDEPKRDIKRKKSESSESGD